MIILFNGTLIAAERTIAGAKMVIPALKPLEVRNKAAVNNLVFLSKRFSRN
jgi:hypothetical protein